MKYYAQVRIIDGELADNRQGLNFHILPESTFREREDTYGDCVESLSLEGTWYFVECEYEED